MQLTDNEDDIKVEDNKIEIKNKITTELKKKKCLFNRKKITIARIGRFRIRSLCGKSIWY